MTDLSRLLDFLTNANLAYEMEEYVGDKYYGDNTRVTLGSYIQNEINENPIVGGYAGFNHEFEFSKNGKLLTSNTHE